MYKDERRLDFYPIGKALKAARENKKWTQEQVGQLIDRDARTVLLFENKGQHPRLNTFFQLMTMFDISVDQFFFPADNARKSELRHQIDISLSSLSEKELIVIKATIQGLLNARETEE